MVLHLTARGVFFLSTCQAVFRAVSSLVRDRESTTYPRALNPKQDRQHVSEAFVAYARAYEQLLKQRLVV